MTTATDGLRVEGVQVRYGGNIAVDEMSLVAPPASITGLIGPNGAGKTTTFNACTGLVRPSSGRVLLHGVDITTRAAHRRAQLGMGRTFQRVELFASLTVRENIALGSEAVQAGSRPLAHLRASRSQRTMTDATTRSAIELCHLEDIADAPVASLSTGHKRLVELARATATGADLLLLDEPSSGLDPSETRTFGDILLTLVATRGLGILLVEHDMSLVMRVCDHVYVLDFGRLIFAGTPQEIAASSDVRAAYLGDPLE